MIPAVPPAAQPPDFFCERYIERFTVAELAIDPDTQAVMDRYAEAKALLENKEWLMRTYHNAEPDVRLVAQMVGLDLGDVMEALEIDFICSECGQATELTATEDAYGTPMLGCEHCAGQCIDRRGKLIDEDPRADESRWVEAA
jgi:hypothetical protein